MIEPWTNQTAAVAGLLGIRAQEYQRNVCRYRGPRGLKCYFGHLIPDELYASDMENRLCGEIMDRLASTGLFTNLDRSLMAALQHLHDDVLCRDGKDAFEEDVKRIFEKYNLEYPAP